jgi:hypothetical protein
MLEDEDKTEDLVEEETVEKEEEQPDEKEVVEASSEGDRSSDKSDDDELASYSEGVKKRINKLTYKTREAERRESEALEYARAVKAELDVLKKRETTLSKSLESEAETRLKTQEQLYKDQYKFAVDSGDVDKQVEVNTYLAQLAVEKERLRNYREYRRETEAAPERPMPQPTQRPVPDRKAQDWAERNTWFGSERGMTAVAYTIHDDLIAEGYNASGDEYYRELDSRMRKEFPNKFAPPAAKKPTSAVASGRPTQVKKASNSIELTDTQKIIAKRLGVSYDDYKRQLKLVQERID